LFVCARKRLRRQNESESSRIPRLEQGQCVLILAKQAELNVPFLRSFGFETMNDLTISVVAIPAANDNTSGKVVSRRELMVMFDSFAE
jgi:hypothetical protein